MMSEDIFRIDSSNRLLNHVYQQDNIRVIEGMAKNKQCIIFCSSNGLYFPDTYEEFRTKIICNNYFEGGRLSSLLIDYVERIILIRDIRKRFYVTGISEKFNSIDCVLELLANLTAGYEIIATGSSSGGYMAAIIGLHLNAKLVISAGGQWNLNKCNNVTETCYFLRKNRENTLLNKYYDLSKMFQDNRVPIFYMYGGLNESDISQVRYAKDVRNLYPIAIKSYGHAASVSTESYSRLLCAAREDILNIYHKNRKELIETDRLEEQINNSIKLPKGFVMKWSISSERKSMAYRELMHEWIKRYQKIVGRGITNAYAGCHKVAIWGKGRYCSILQNELKMQKIELMCIIETQPLGKMYEGVPIVNIYNIPEEVELIIVVPYYDIMQIQEKCMEVVPHVKVIGIDEYIKSQ